MNLYIFNYNDLQDLTLIEIGKQKCSPLYSFGPFTRNDYIFHYVVSGKGYCAYGPSLNINRFAPSPDSEPVGIDITSASRILEVHAGEGFLIEPHTEHIYYADETDPWDYIWIVFRGLAVPQYLHDCGFSKVNMQYRPKTKSIQSIQKTKNHLLKILEHHDAPKAFILGHLHLFFAELAANADLQYSNTALLPANTNFPAAKLHQENQLTNFYVSQSIHYMNCYYSTIKSLDEIAAYCNLSRSHLSRLFNQHLKISLQDYLIQTRLSKACTLLTDTTLSIREIANQVGYQNELNLYRAFKTRYGMSPSEYRRRNTL